MRRPIVAKQSLDLQSNHYLRRSPGYPLGISLGELDYLRGWKDDFFGDALADQYTVAVNAGGVILRDTYHGGHIRIRANAGIGNWARLWLGDAVGGYDTLDADEGWVQIARARFYDDTNCTMLFGATDVTINNDSIWAGNIAGTWQLRCTSGGVTTTVNSGIAVDVNNQHWHVIDAYPTDAGRQVDYYLDGTPIASCTTNVPTVFITPIWYVLNNDAGDLKQVGLDYWAVIPRNL